MKNLIIMILAIIAGAIYYQGSDPEAGFVTPIAAAG